MKKDVKKIELLRINAKKIFSEASSKTFAEICPKLKLIRKRNVANTLF